MKPLFSMVMITFLSLPAVGQGLQDGSHGSGGDEKGAYTISVNSNWNILSVPLEVPDSRRSTLFPTATSPAFAFTTQYVARDTMQNGIGYWLKFAAPQNLPLNGDAILTDSIPVRPIWNMIGSISHPVASSSITAFGTTIQSSFFKYNAGYQVASTIEPGGGYWVKTSSAGTLVLSASSVPAKRSAQDSMIIVLEALNSLTISDAAGGSQTLYFGPTDAHIAAFAGLPPVPPSGIFDVRFSSHSMVTSGDQDIQLSSATFPVEVTWSVTTPGNYLLSVDEEETSLNSAGSLRLDHPASRFSLKVAAASELPREFSLSQNFPNPFNPTTNIRFALPVQSHVRMELHNILGQRVATVVSDELPAGYHVVSWNGLGDNGQTLGTGTYFLRLTANGAGGRNFTETRKLMLLK